MNSPFVSVTVLGETVTGVVPFHGSERPVLVAPKVWPFSDHAKFAAVFGGFAGQFISWVGTAAWNLLEIIFSVVSPNAWSYIQRTGAALKSILQNPIPFVGNLFGWTDPSGVYLKSTEVFRVEGQPTATVPTLPAGATVADTPGGTCPP